LRNAATAIAALRALPDALPTEAYAQGVANAELPGRLQRFVLNGVEVVLDVAHNPQAARELHAWLQQAPSPGRTCAVFAALGDKDIAGIVGALAADVDGWFLAGLDEVGPRGLAIDAFVHRLRGSAAQDGRTFATVGAALAAALEGAGPGDRVLVFGSFHTVAAALEMLQS